MPALRRADQTKPFRLTTAHVDKGAHSSARWMCRGDQRVPRHDNSGVSYAGVRLIQPDERYAVRKIGRWWTLGRWERHRPDGVVDDPRLLDGLTLAASPDSQEFT